MASKLAITLVGTGLALAGVLVACGLAADRSSIGQDPELNQLLQERRDALALRVQVVQQHHVQGLRDRTADTAARIDLLEAELELAEGKAERVEILEQRVDLFREREEIFNAMRQAPTVPRVSGERPVLSFAAEDALMATADRIQAQIDLLRERQSAE